MSCEKDYAELNLCVNKGLANEAIKIAFILSELNVADVTFKMYIAAGGQIKRTLTETQGLTKSTVENVLYIDSWTENELPVYNYDLLITFTDSIGEWDLFRGKYSVTNKI